MTSILKAYVCPNKGEKLTEQHFSLPELPAHQVEIEVLFCGICHSDLSMIHNEWGNTQYPLVAGHEIIGRIGALGSHITHLQLGDLVGLGWHAESCGVCPLCLRGEPQYCEHAKPTIEGRFGGFANKVRADAHWVIPLPKHINIDSAGPLLCGGITVFTPLLQHNINALHTVGVVGIGGLGHIAIKLYKAFGCEVYAFTSNENKVAEIKALGADHVIVSSDIQAMKAIRGKLDLLVSTVNVALNWPLLMSTLTIKGVLHIVGALLTPLNIPPFSLIGAAKAVSGSTTGSPTHLHQLLHFCARHHIEPTVEIFPMQRINEAIERLESGQARYRIVLKNDFQA